MYIKEEYGWKDGGMIADWACHVCHRVIYPKTNASDLPRSIHNDPCDRCGEIMELAYRLAEKLKMEHGVRGSMYDLRDELSRYFNGKSPGFMLRRVLKQHRELIEGAKDSIRNG